MKFVGPDWKSNNKVPIATRSTPGTVIPGDGIQLNELTGEISVTTGVFTITYDLDGGTNSASNPVMYSYNSDAITLVDPTKTGYIFQGWTGSNGNTPQKGITITPSPESVDLSYTANWTPNLYTITYNVDGSTSTVNCYHGDTISEPVAPTKNGYTFSAWQKNGVNYNFSSTVTESFTLTATWTKDTYTITYTLNGGTNNANNPSSYTITDSTITLRDASKTGYTFQGWTGSNGNTPAKNPTIPTGSYGNKAYTANFKINTYTVTWKQVFKDKNDNVISQSTYYTQNVNYNNTPTSGYPTTIPAVDKYTSPSKWVYEGTTTQFNASTPITADTTIVAYYVRQSTTYAYVVDENNSTPSTRVSYPSGYDNSSFVTPATMGSTTFSYGSWNGAFIFDHFKPCALKYDGTVDYYLNPNDYSKKENGTSSDYNNINYNGNMMVQVKKMYTKRVYDSTNKKRYFYVSDIKKDDDYECDAFKNSSGQEVDYIYLPLFKGSKDGSNRLRSIAGQVLSDCTNTEEEVTYASNNGSRWQIWDFSSHELIRDLCTLISKTTDSQTAFGPGHSASSNSDKANSGGLYNKGMFWGGTNKQQVKVFHIEDFWGNRLDRMLGLILYNYDIYTKGYPPYSYTSTDGYTNQGNCGISSSSKGGFYKTAKWTRNGQIPTWTGGSGSATTYECDRTYFNDGTRIARFGGNWVDGTECGSGYITLYSNATSFDSGNGASPVYK